MPCGDYSKAIPVPSFRPGFFNGLRGKMHSRFHAKGKSCRFTRQEMPGPGKNCLPEKRDSLQVMQSKGFARNHSMKRAKIGKDERKGESNCHTQYGNCQATFHSAFYSWQGASCRHHGKPILAPSSRNLIASALHQRTSIHYLLPILSEVIDATHCKPGYCNASGQAMTQAMRQTDRQTDRASRGAWSVERGA